MAIEDGFDLVVFNENTSTYSSTSTSVIDLGLSFAQLATMCDSYVDMDTHGSDHFPVVTQIDAQVCFKSNFCYKLSLRKEEFDELYRYLLSSIAASPPEKEIRLAGTTFLCNLQYIRCCQESCTGRQRFTAQQRAG